VTVELRSFCNACGRELKTHFNTFQNGHIDVEFCECVEKQERYLVDQIADKEDEIKELSNRIKDLEEFIENYIVTDDEEKRERE
jgi:hypothetical protein